MMALTIALGATAYFAGCVILVEMMSDLQFWSNKTLIAAPVVLVLCMIGLVLVTP